MAAKSEEPLNDLPRQGCQIELGGLNKAVLTDLVKFVQKQGWKGDKGVWIDFLESYSKGSGSRFADPSRNSTGTLTAFIQTFTKEEDAKLIAEVLKRFKDWKKIQEYMGQSSDNVESAEQKLVRLTLEHPHCMQNYSFPSHEEGWVIVPLGKKLKAIKAVSMVAIDCEMVLCEDGSEAVVKVCVVNDKLEVILDKYVKPEIAIVDYREGITGICAKDLEGETCSLVDIQKFLKRILRNGTILVGHSLHNDLRALKIDYLRVIDTAYLFKCKKLPSLISLCKAVLAVELRKEGEPHNCLNDAKAAMKLVLAKLERGFVDPFITQAQNEPVLFEEDHTKLMIHAVPRDIPCEELLKLFPTIYDVDIEKDVRIKGNSYSTFAVFKDSKQADEAFEAIPGQRSKDSHGRPHKRVLLKSSFGKSSSFYISKSINNPEGIPSGNESNDPASSPQDELSMLLLHHVPVVVPCTELVNLFRRHPDVHIVNNTRIKGGYYSTYAVFKDSKEADEAFEGIRGLPQTDSDGRPQKRIFLRTKSGESFDLRVRKMVSIDPSNNFDTEKPKTEYEELVVAPQRLSFHHIDSSQKIEIDGQINGLDLGKLGRSFEDELLHPKRPRALRSTDCDHAEEVETLRKKLKEREDEIFYLQRTLFSILSE